MEYFAYSQKAFVYKYVVMLSDSDQFKHMSFANYLRLLFLATDALFVSFVNEDFLAEHRLKLVHTKMQFKRQTVSGDSILIKINSSETNESKFSLLYTLVIEVTGELVGLARQVYEVVSIPEGRGKKLPQRMSDLLKPIGVNEEHLIYQY